MLTDFLKINLPYGLTRNDDGEWMAFNKNYCPIGYNKDDKKIDNWKHLSDIPLFTKYKGLTNKFIIELIGEDGSINYDDDGNVCEFNLYNDSSNPMNESGRFNELWDRYFEKLKKLSKLSRKI